MQLRVERAAAKVAGMGELRWPETFGGAWVDGRRAFVAFTQPPPRGLKKLRRVFPKPGQLRQVIVDDSLRELEALIRRASADREAQLIRPPCTPAPPPPPGIRPPPSPRSPNCPPAPGYDLAIDVARNSVVATVEKPDAETLQLFQSRYGSGVLVEQGLLARPRACFLCPRLRGGMVTTGTSQHCTIGFTARYQGLSAEKSNLVLSAGHCNGDALYTYQFTYQVSGVPLWYGQVVTQEWGEGSVDAEVHTVHPSIDATRPLVCGVFGCKKPLTVNKVGHIGPGTNDLVQGMTTCLYGKNTGFSCGEVTSMNYWSDHLGNTEMVKTEACSQSGDSGGPVFSFYPLKPSLKKPSNSTFFDLVTEALEGIFEPVKPPSKGLMAQGLISSGPPLGCPNPDNYTIFSHIDYIDSALPIFVNQTWGK